MSSDLVSTLVLSATAADGLLAGASLDQSIKQLPARHRIGAVAYSEYSRASDLGNGIAFYAVLGVGAATLTIAAAAAAIRSERGSTRARRLKAAATLALLHSLATTQAAPANFRQRQVQAGDAEALSRIFDRFARWQAVRAALQVANLAAMLWVLAASQAKGA